MSCFYVSAQLQVCSSHALSRLVSCWSMVFGSRHSCLEFQFRIGVQTLALHVLSRFGSMQSRVRSAACSSVYVCCCMQFVFYRLRAFMLCLVVCGTQLVFLMGCVLSCCHVLNEHVAYEYSYELHVRVLFCTWLVILFCWPCACVFVLCKHMALS